jgi:hypothetical protein
VPVVVVTEFVPFAIADAPETTGATEFAGVEVTGTVVAVDLVTPAGTTELLALTNATRRFPAAFSGITSGWLEAP